jgi:murein hydrolase activator
LRDSERAISQANRNIGGLEGERRRLRSESARLGERRRKLDRELDERKVALARLLAARAAAGAPDALRVVLSGEDPASAARLLYYAGYVSRAGAGVLGAYRASIAELERLAGEAEDKRRRLLSVEQAARAERATLVAERRERRLVLDRVGADIRKGRREIGVLRADEARLARLVEGIGRIVQGTALDQPFSKLRGRLIAPVRGELTGRFGAPRGAGIEAKGVFIRAPAGQPVRAVARGRVVYADWMRGFGNLLIVDHGETYLTIYANNEALLKQVGDAVGPGDAIATTGASGGNEETGLYFELRHLGRAFDPLRWVKLK